MARFLLLIVLVYSAFSCRDRSEHVEQVNAKKVAIEIPKTIDKDYQVIALRDLGVIYEGEQLKGEFYLTILSDSTLKVNEIKGTCGCMQLIADFTTISKDEVVTVGYTIDSKFKEGEEYFDLIFDTTIGVFIVEQKAIVKN